MTREEHIIDFVQRIRSWLADQGDLIVEIEDRGGENSDEWELIMTKVEQAEWALLTVYDNQFLVIDSADSFLPKYNFQHDWSDAKIIQFMSDWKTKLGVDQSPAVSVALETLTLLEAPIASGGSGIQLPAGGTDGDILVKSGNGVALQKPATVFDMGETT